MSTRTITLSLEQVEPALAADIEAIAAARGRPLSLDEVCELRARAEEIRAAMTGEAAALEHAEILGRVVSVGAVELRELSMAGLLAMRKLVGWAALLDQDAYDVLEAWVYAHSWDWAEIGRLTSPFQAAAIAAEWGSRLTCTRAELAAAVQTLRGQAAAAPQSEREPDLRQVLAGLLSRFAGDPRVWLTMPLGLVNGIAAGARANDQAEAAAGARARGVQMPAGSDERVNAVGRYRETRERLMARTAEGSADGR